MITCFHTVSFHDKFSVCALQYFNDYCIKHVRSNLKLGRTENWKCLSLILIIFYYSICVEMEIWKWSCLPTTLYVCNPRYPILNLTWRVTSTFLRCTKMWLGHIKKQKLPLEAHVTTSSSYQMNVSSSVPVINSLLVIKHFYARVNAEVPWWIVVISPEKQTGNLCFPTWGTLRRLFYFKTSLPALWGLGLLDHPPWASRNSDTKIY